jgi:rhodanese-related sulfurtransferase
MKSLRNQVFFFIAILSSFACSNKQQANVIESVPVQKFEELTVSDANTIILDVRTPEEFADGHLKGAMLTDFQNQDFKNEIDKLDKSKTYLIYCKAGVRQEKAAEHMKSIGFENIYLLEGGFTAWQQEGKPIEK